MNKRLDLRWLAPAALAVLGLLLGSLAGEVHAQVAPKRPKLPDFDKRASEPRASVPGAVEAAQARLKAQVPAAEVNLDPVLGSPAFVRAHDGFLTGPNGQGRGVSAVAAQGAAGDPHGPVKAFLNEHAALFGHGAEALAPARVTRESVGRHNGLRTVVWQQQVDGIPLFESVLIGNITAKGELVSLSSRFVPDPEAAAAAGFANHKGRLAQLPVAAEQAVVNAARNVGDDLSLDQVVSEKSVPPDAEQKQRLRASPALKGDTHAQLVWLPMQPGALRLCWQVLLTSGSRSEMFLVLVDAQSGEVLLRRCLTEYISDASYRVFTSDSPSPFSPGHPGVSSTQPPLVARQFVVTNAFDATASPSGWIDDGDNETRGNNVDAHLDRNDDNQPDLPRPQGNPNRVFDFTLDLTQDPTSYGSAAVVQLFYYNNWMHDRLYQLGFDEAAGNFQSNNFNRGGLGGDAILADAQDGLSLNDTAHDNNANMSTPPDGFPPRMQMYRFSGPAPDRDGDLDGEVVLHEHTHGLSNRRVGGGVGISAWQTAGMGEGWSDFYPMSLLSEATDDVNGNYPSGGYVTYQFFGLTENYYYGIRRYPYSTDMTRNPLTFKDIDPTQASPHTGVPRNPISGPFFPFEASEVHNAGEVWCVTLWEARANLVAKHGWAVGNELTLQLVTDGMALSPPNPTFLQARDGILLADRILTGGANFLPLWLAFAKRGMGFSAVAPPSSTTTGVVEAYDLPGLGVDSVTVSGGNGNGVIDFNECNALSITLINNSGDVATGITGRLSTRTPGVIVAQPVSAFPDTPMGGTNVNLTPFKISTAPAFLCGTPVDCSLVIKSDQETRTNTIRLLTGSRGTSLRFNNNSMVAIPDATPSGAVSPIVVTNFSTAVSKVAVSLFLTHTFDADLRLQLISPDGLTCSLSANNGGAGDNYGTGCGSDATRTSFDDDASQSIAGAAAPFVGTFKPDQPLSLFVGKTGSGVNGTWQLKVIDDYAFDTGTIQCWSLVLWPAECTDGGGECAGVDLAIGLADMPDPVSVGSNLVYTITMTNFGPSTAKNTLMNQYLPASVVFVGATVSQGTIGQAGGIVSANLGNLAAGATATATVTVLPAASGVISSSASIAATDTDYDPGNNTATATTQVHPPSADMAVSIGDLPDPVLVGGTLSYMITVVNNGPSPASGVVVTNPLPGTVVFISAGASQGNVVRAGGVVVASLGSLTNGGRATVTVNVSPLAVGTVTGTAQVGANQADPIPDNNTASTVTTVGPAAGLVLGLTDAPDPVVVGSNWTYVVTVTNRGPSVATAVTITHTLPGSVTVISTDITQGAVADVGSVLTANIGTVAVGAGARLTVVVNSPVAATLSSTATVTAAQTDPNTADNTASVSTSVLPPFVSILPAGATLTAESISPPNGAIEPGETVTVQLRLRNAGNVSNTNLVATLLATGGVISPSGPTNYGALEPSGVPVARDFTFTAGGINGGSVTATLQLQDGANNLGTVSFTFLLPVVLNFANANAITIRDSTSASPYPSVINVSGVTGLVDKVAITLANLSHTYPDDVDVLLVGPTGQKTILMSDAGGGGSLAGANVTFDQAGGLLPDEGQIISAAFAPADYEPGDSFPAPAPGGPYGANLGGFNGANPNGAWSLYIVDDTVGDAGSIAGGWSVAITMITPVNQVADLGLSVTDTPDPALMGDNITNTFTITNGGPNTASGVIFTNLLPPGVVLVSATASQAICVTNASAVVCSLGSLNLGSNATVTIVVQPASAGNLTNTASVSASENDLNLGNNSATALTSIGVPVADLSMTMLALPEPATLGSNLVYTIAITNRGPNTALNVVVTDALPAGLHFLSATSPVGAWTNVAGVVTGRLGNLVNGAEATITITVTATNVGPVTNHVTLSTASSDPTAADNAASFISHVLAPAPQIVAAGVTLVSESFIPHNGVPDAGETVTVALALANTGLADTTNLVATLQDTGGVSAPSDPQNYGPLAHGGAAVARQFTFTASGANGGVVTTTLQLQDGVRSLGTVSFVLSLPTSAMFVNALPITIPDHGIATPYPSTISVTGLTGLVSKVAVTLSNVNHAFPDDVDVLLAGPSGQKLVLMSDAGGGHPCMNLVLTFDDAAVASLSDSAQLSAGTNKPTDYEPGDVFPAPAPPGSAGATLSVFNGTTPNGDWSLYVSDDSMGDAGIIADGWSLNLTVVNPINPAADVSIVATDAPDPLLTSAILTYSVIVTNHGPAAATGVRVADTLPAGVNFVSATASQGSCTNAGNTVICNLGSLAAGNQATLTVVVTPTQAGAIANTFTVTANETDLNLANSTAQVMTMVTNPSLAHLAGTVVPTNGYFQLTLTGQPGQTHAIEVSTNLFGWIKVHTNTTAGNGTFKFTDTNAPSFKYRFYRAVRLP